MTYYLLSNKHGLIDHLAVFNLRLIPIWEDTTGNLLRDNPSPNLYVTISSSQGHPQFQGFHDNLLDSLA
jgi:hypothetical protein